ncbi:nucleotide exchange factor GrpE [Pengzhenrongella phosphoraccumulans]|uniref:nucleotide exchange factor GrpE n=1 Tax=Pengzhenrongella phosphoraccumulans TaxID=3114394 RepID=UPI00388F4110
MTEHPVTGAAGEGEPDPGRPVEPPKVTDKRRIDPETGAVRESAPAGDEALAGEQGDPLAGLDFEPSGSDAELIGAVALADERLGDLQRVQAEYVNYRRRVERDRSVARDQAVSQVLEAMIPVLDDIELARQHGELEGTPFAAIAEKLEASLTRFGWERYGAIGEVFDPQVHEALMHQHSDDVTEPTVSLVMQPGHRVGGRVVRAARVAVADPDA